MILRKLLNRLGFHAPGRPGTERSRADALIASGNLAERQGNLEQACRDYRAAAAAAPNFAGPLLNLGIALEALGRADDARGSYEAALRIDPGDAYINFNLGKLLYGKGESAKAEVLLRAALTAKPDFPEALVVLASVQEDAGNLPAAATSLEAALALRPDYAGALRNYGMLLERLGRAAESEAILQRAIAADPQDAQACFRLGKLLADRGAAVEAARWLGRALQAEPGYADAHLGLGNVLAAAGRLEEAAQCFRQALALDPGLTDAHVNLASVLKDQGQMHEAQQCCRAALALDPESATARWMQLMCLIPPVRQPMEDLGEMRRRFGAELAGLDAWFDATRSAAGHEAVGVAQPFWLAYQEADNRELLQRYGKLCARLMGTWHARQELPRPRARAPGPVRVGIVSQFFRDHSVWHALVKGWFQQLDRRRFELSAFCLDASEDGETRYAKSRAARFVQGVGGLRQWIDAIGAAAPDVLIYPEIGMDPLSLKLASLRLAPVQAATWGHPETTGLPTIDAYLSAQDLEPEGAQAHYTERLVLLPNLGCYLQAEPVDSAPPDLASLGVENGAPLLLCPGTPFKYAPEQDQALAEVARRLGRCQMVFFEHRTRALSQKLRARLAAAFGAAGVDFDGHVRFIPWQTRQGFHGLLGRADVFLDTIGFSGFNTALQAVQCGLPIVTREGRFLRGRLASGILRRIGLQELIAADAEQYIALAVKLAQDRDYREGIRRRFAAARSLLYEDPAPVRALEAFLAQGV